MENGPKIQAISEQKLLQQEDDKDNCDDYWGTQIAGGKGASECNTNKHESSLSNKL